MADLFEAAGLTPHAPSPLADRLRPQSLIEVVGQAHLLGPEGLKATSTTAAMWHIARFVGARPAKRDAIDQRIISAALSGTAHQIAPNRSG